MEEAKEEKMVSDILKDIGYKYERLEDNFNSLAELLYWNNPQVCECAKKFFRKLIVDNKNWLERSTKYTLESYGFKNDNFRV